MRKSDSPDVASIARDVFIEAINHREGPERNAYVSTACRDSAELRAEVNALLAVAGSAETFMETDPSGRVIGPHKDPEGTSIGPYRIMDWIGEGGFADVYRARQIDPIRREVALKIIKPGMDSREVVARFEVERQALALMEHPNIAKVFDAGTTKLGRPYFAMELVRGVPITAYCDNAGMPIPERLQLFRQVCGGVLHAHQRGILHRDLKPSNIVVTPDPSSESPIPKIIDFGIAKYLQGSLTERTLVSQRAVLLGTPAFMSPEQLDLDSDNLDTRTDVYALGVLLYELLTGVRPFDSDLMRQASFSEVCRLVREVVPPKPSARVAAFTGDPGKTLRSRSVDRAMLSRLLKGDLDWITMKAIEKDRDRRYPGASDLAADIERHRTHLPVVAGPPGRMYRLGKFTLRHRVGVAMSVAFALAVLIGFVAILRSYRNEITQRQLAESARARAQELVNFIIKDQQPKLASSGNRQEIMDSAMAAVRYYEQLPLETRNEATLREHAAALRTLEATVGWNFSSLHDEKGPKYWQYAWEQGEPVWRQISELDPDDGEAAANALFATLPKSGFTNVVEVLNDLRELEKRFPETIAVQTAIVRVLRGSAVTATGPASVSSIDRARTRTTRLVEKHPDHKRLKSEHITNHWASGIVYDREGRFEEGAAFVEQGWTIAEDLLATDPTHWGFLVITIHLLEALTDHFDRTERIRGERVDLAIEHLTDIKTIDPEDSYWWQLCSKQYYHSALVNLRDRNYLQADNMIQSAVSDIGVVPKKYFQRQWWDRYIGLAGIISTEFEGSWFDTASCLSLLRDDATISDGAEEISWKKWADLARHKHGPKIWRRASDTSPPAATWSYRNERFLRMYYEAEILERLESWPQVEDTARRMIADADQLTSSFPDWEEPSAYLAISQALLGKALLKQGDLEQARPSLVPAVQWFRGQDDPLPPEVFPWRPWDAADNLGLILLDSGEADAAIDVLEWAFRSSDAYVRRNDALAANRIRTAHSAWTYANALSVIEPVQAARRTEVLTRAAELLDDPNVFPKLLPDERAMREAIGVMLHQTSASPGSGS